jgi:uroporphyrinogen-III decarboxylase
MKNSTQAITAKMSFAAPYWHERHGINYSREYLSTPDKYIDNALKCSQYMTKKRAELLSHSLPTESDLAFKPNPVVEGYVTTTLPMMLGCEVDFQDSEYPHARPLDLNDEEVMALEPIVDFSDNPVMQDLEMQAAWVKRKYGKARIAINTQSVVNIAFKLRGDQLMFDFFDNPQIAHKLIDYTQQCWINIHKWISRVNKENGMPDKGGMVSLDNCNAALLSPDIYHDFFLPYDLKSAAVFSGKLGVHHCGGNMEKFAADYASLGKAVWYDIGFGSDVRECVDTFEVEDVKQEFSVRYGPARFRSADADDVINELDKLAKSGASYVNCLGVDPETPDENLKAFLRWKWCY